MSPPVVHIVDDDASFLLAVARLLRAKGFAVKTYSSSREFFDRAEPHHPGCVVADLHMPVMDGLKLQAALARTRNPLPILFLTGNGDIPNTVLALRGGAEDFLEKSAPKEHLFAAVERALERDARERKERAQRDYARSCFDRLSGRELQVLDLVVKGRLNKQIAAELGIHERTVKLHRTSITTKLGVPSVAELTVMTMEAGLFTRAVDLP